MYPHVVSQSWTLLSATTKIGRAAARVSSPDTAARHTGATKFGVCPGEERLDFLNIKKDDVERHKSDKNATCDEVKMLKQVGSPTHQRSTWEVPGRLQSDGRVPQVVEDVKKIDLKMKNRHATPESISKN